MLNNRGLTMIEMLVVAAIIALIAIPLNDYLLKGLQLNKKTFRQTAAQDAAVKILEEMGSGFEYDGIKISGFRATGEITYDIPDYNRVAYLAGSYVVSYFLTGSTLYRSVHPYSGSVVINESEGIKIAGNIKTFSVEPDGDMVSIALSIGQDEDVNIKSRIELETKILPRNLP